MGYQFSLVLSREINDEESTTLREANSAAPIFGTDSLPTDAAVTVTKMDFDDTVSATLAEAIESALDSVKKVPDLSVPSLTVPAQPAEPAAENPPVLVGEIVEDTPGTKKASARKPAAKRTSAKKASKDEAAEPVATSSNGHAGASANGASSANGATAPTEAATGPN